MYLVFELKQSQPLIGQPVLLSHECALAPNPYAVERMFVQ